MSPSNAGTRARRRVAAMQPPVGVPAKGGPAMFALVTRPDGEKVMVTTATPLGSPGFLQLEACATAPASAVRAASALKGPSGAVFGGSAGAGVPGAGAVL